MKNKDLMEMTCDITKTLISTSSINYIPNESSAKEVAKILDVIYNKLVELAEKNTNH